jgi:hypothetical protein
VDFTSLPARSHKLLLDRGLKAGVGIGDAQTDSFQPSLLQLAEKRPLAVLRLIKHGFYGQDLSVSRPVDPMRDHQS